MPNRKHFQVFIDALRLSRLNNLIIIFLTQYFAAFFLLSLSVRPSMIDILLDYRFFAMVLSTVIIAASGYYINDYYDIKMDLINKPDKVIVGRQFRRRPVLFAHVVFNGVGILLGSWVSLWIGLVNLICTFLLWLYSNQLKRMPFLGNLLVAALTGATLLLLNLYFRTHSILIYAFSFFAFGITLIREIIKDIEDLEGDVTFDSNSLPIALGVRRTKYILYVLIGGFSIALTLFLLRIDHLILSVYFAVLALPFTFFVYGLIVADTKKSFTDLSRYCKWLIIAGIFSMVLLKF